MVVNEVADKLSAWLEAKLKESGTKSFIVGLSGGVDSAVVAGLCQRVRPNDTYGVIMPCHSNPDDAKYGRMVAEAFNIPVKEVVLDEVFDALVARLTDEPYEKNKQNLAFANIKPRLRMTTLYFYASKYKGLVVGTGNKAEITVGFYTKYGDGGCDLLPIANLVKAQVYELARYLGVPQPIIDKKPSAGLWHGHDDEEEMGVTYRELDRYILTGEAEPRVKRIVDQLHRQSEHKRHMPPIPPEF
ncbi:NAD+ synthase [Desulfohalotomaculum tongense]|uniref:NAD(+) synthase n=1 Tax=Desulforadius tongensis TaxID=1216062 RepID=UPI0030843A81|nr:NAD+ synthase [Desulforadius tongensis]